MIFGKKTDPIIKLKLKEAVEKIIPVIISLKEPPSNRLKNSITKNRGKLKYQYKYINAIAAQLNPQGVERLSELPEISFISYDRTASVCMDRTSKYVGINYNNPYALTGKNVNIAIVDTGVYPHGDLMRPYRVVTAFKDFINSYGDSYDDNGHGTHLCGVISGSGSLSEGKYKGIAVNSKIIMLKAFNNIGAGLFSDIIASIDWIIENSEKYKIRVLCLPFGAEAIVSSRLDPLCTACETAWNKGIIVVASSGNNGPYQGTVTTPGICPEIITVGCCEARNPDVKNWRIPPFSGRGSKTDDHTKPELAAPGVDITSISSNTSYIPGNSSLLMHQSLEKPYCSLTGSSVSAAVVAGCIALLLEKKPTITGRDVKGMLKLSCQTLNDLKTVQGQGVINMGKLLDI